MSTPSAFTTNPTSEANRSAVLGTSTESQKLPAEDKVIDCVTRNFVKNNDDVRQALEFANGGFQPFDEVNYDWVYDYANERFKDDNATFKDLEDKAASIITWFGAGIGLVAISAVSAFADGKISVWAVVASLIPVGFALRALYLALKSRRAVSTYYPPSVQGAIQLADFADKKAKAHFAAHIHVANTMMIKVLAEKSAWVDSSFKFAIRAVALILVPFLVAIFTLPPKNQANLPPIKIHYHADPVPPIPAATP